MTMVVLGEGRIAGVLSGLEGATAVVAASDGWDLTPVPRARELASSLGCWLIPVRTELGRIVIGPAERQGLPGCAECGELRRSLARDDAAAYDAVRRQHGPTLAARPAPGLTALAIDLAAALVAEDAAADGLPRSRNALVYIDLETLEVRVHRFLPDPRCEVCGRLPSDSEAAARLELPAVPKPGRETYRTRELNGELEALRELYVSSEAGLIGTPKRGHEGGVAVTSAPIGLRDRTREFSFGRAHSYRRSELTALLEGLERYGGVQPGARRTSVAASYGEIRDRAIDPRSLGLYAQELYDLPGFPFTSDVDTVQCDWVWAYSFLRRKPVLIPEGIAYYRMHNPFACEVSNGCALGANLTEAILFGLLEVAERDAFLMTWHARMRVPRIDLDSAGTDAVHLVKESIEYETGYRVLAFDMTLEQGIPCVWAMAVDRQDSVTRPKVACAAGSHLNPRRAVENALSELGPILTNLVRKYPERAEDAAAMVANPFLVADMEDHSLLYGHRAAFERFAFLLGQDPTRSVSGMAGVPGSEDLREDLLRLVERYLLTGLDVLVVDQTTAEHEAGGFACVKVIVPGSIPMTFGHAFSRAGKIPRLCSVPRKLGHRDRGINEHPHPFP
ncbi:TOMM precursor leader peptide-binding protein [[Actinomadura] parvosata]|uniref:TOMM precursor leader peptide-binding protein n=1 Tax=[Actinomadura] parvosata TaxID=1955412 RepID=UPI00406C48FE